MYTTVVHIKVAVNNIIGCSSWGRARASDNISMIAKWRLPAQRRCSNFRTQKHNIYHFPNSPAILGCGAGISTKARRGWHTAAIVSKLFGGDRELTTC